MDWRRAQHGSGVNAAFKVRYTDAARDDLLRLFDLLLDRAQTAEDFGLAQCAIDTITLKVESNLSRSPFIFRKAGQSPFLRELVITSGSSGMWRYTRFQTPGQSTSWPSGTSCKAITTDPGFPRSNPPIRFLDSIQLSFRHRQARYPHPKQRSLP